MMRPFCVLICALGGEGGGVLAQWIVDAARAAGVPAQATSIPGVAQRTGATTYYIELLPEIGQNVPTAQLSPVFSLNPVPGQLDLLISSELLETARQVSNAMTSATRTCVITSTARALTTHEKMQLADGRADDAALLAMIRAYSAQTIAFDMNDAAKEAQTIVSAVMIGAMAACLPIPIEHLRTVIGHASDGKSAASLRGFELGNQKARTIVAPIETPAPPTVDLEALAMARLTEYQDASYAALYQQRLARFANADVRNALVRWLALWMAFDDIVRVAQLKARATRAARVRTEVKAAPDEIVKLYDHFKPGVPEFAALLPDAPAQQLTRWDARRRAQGASAWALPLKLPSHSIGGLLALRFLGSLKWLRRRGQRFAHEQALIEEWLAAIATHEREAPAVALALAECGALIKGYGSTNERGKETLLHIVRELAQRTAFATAKARADAITVALQAALKDDAGTAFKSTLSTYGATLPPPKAQPIQWMRKPKVAAKVP